MMPKAAGWKMSNKREAARAYDSKSNNDRLRKDCNIM